MPINANDDTIVQLVLHGSYGAAVELVNVFNYHVETAGLATLTGLGAGLWEKLTLHVLPLSSDDVEYFRIDVSELDTSGLPVTGEPYIIPATHGVGLVAAESLPPADCYTFKYVNSIARQRHGFKRFAGVPEAASVNGQISAGYIANAVLAATDLSEQLFAWLTDVDGLPSDPVDGSVIKPVILHRMRFGDVLDPVEWSPVLTVSFDKIGHQDTRDYGRGS